VSTATDPSPRRSPRAAYAAAVFTVPADLTVPTPQATRAVYPDRVPGLPSLAAYMPAVFSPQHQITAPTPQALNGVFPSSLPGRPWRAAYMPAVFSPQHFITPVTPPTPGFGPQGVATLELGLEPGTKITYSWPTAIFKSYNGNEQRISLGAIPRIKIEGVAFLHDTQSRDVRSALMRYAAQGSVFLLGMSNEEVRVAVDSVNTTITLNSTRNVDWLQVGQRALVVAGDDTSVSVVIQSVSSPTTVEIATFNSSGSPTFGVLGSIGLAGARFMPLLQVVLEPQQGFARYPVGADLWSINATASSYGWAGTDSMGIGTTVTTYYSGPNVAIANVTENDLVIWDRGNDVEDTASESMLALTELVDLGAIPFTAGAAVSPDWMRTIKFASSGVDDWQWAKGILRHCRGAQVAFALPSGRADLIYLGVAPPSVTPGGIMVASGAVAGGNDYQAWFASGLYTRLALTLSTGSMQYVTVRSVVDDNAGTLTLTLDQSLDGVVTKVAFLEQVRLESGDVETTWDSGQFAIEMQARVSREVLTLQRGVLFDKIISIFNPNTFPLPPDDQTFGGALGQNTLINWSGDRGCNLCGITNSSGIYANGLVVCVVNVGNTSQTFITSPENTGFPAFVRLQGKLHVDTGIAIWYRYDAFIQRWVQFACTG